ncbi:hypothetical protein ABZV14_27975 [Streptosporangium canum]|uniref:hypothetical protein n=1 Tax=Streptosporangium canum TaxID=324952 RepID=UPI0033A3D82C
MTGRTRAAAGILTALASMSMLMAGALPAHAGEISGPVVATASGKVQGADQSGVHRFRNGAGTTTWPRLGAADRAIELAPEAVRPINMKTAHHCGLWF